MANEHGRAVPVPVAWKRPESVLVIVYTEAKDVLLICRRSPADFWQSVTGSLEPGELPIEAARRELLEETGIDSAVTDHQRSHIFRIKDQWRARYSPEVIQNREHEFSVCLPARCPVLLDPAEHTEYCWLPVERALDKLRSRTNRAALWSIVMNQSVCR